MRFWVNRKLPPKDFFPRNQFKWLTHGDRVGILIMTNKNHPYVVEWKKKKGQMGYLNDIH